MWQICCTWTALIAKLKERVVRNVDSTNLFKYDTDWSDDGGVNSHSHKDYLEKFCSDFENRIKRLIDETNQTQELSTQVCEGFEQPRAVTVIER